MATSSASSTGRQNSRFSSLNVFKISGSSSKAPAPPPKDPLYLANPSMVSLSHSIAQDSSSHPITPISSRYAASARSPSPSPSYSTSSHYAPSTNGPSSNATLSPDSARSKRSIFKMPSFTRRSRTPKSAKSNKSHTLDAPEVVDDSSISMPWNFQHNVHVDDGLAGLPPTWSASLVDMGFTSDEITVINARRAASRSPTLTPLHTQSFHIRTDSAATSSGLSHFQPRSSSLQRDVSDEGSSQQSHSIKSPPHSRHDSDVSRSQHSELPSKPRYDRVVYERPTPRSPETPTLRGRAGSSNGTPPLARSTSPISRQSTPSSPIDARSIHDSPRSTRAPTLPPMNSSSPRLPGGHSPSSHTTPPRSGSYASTPSEKDRPPRTPPRRFHVVNASVSTIPSPPPAYQSHSTEYKSAGLCPPEAIDHDVEDSSDSEQPAPLPSLGSRLPTGPPRLSLHQDELADLSSWTESLFSIIPGSDKLSSPPKAVSTQARPPWPSSSTASSSQSLLHSSNSLKPTPPTVPRPLPLQKPMPLNQLPARRDFGNSFPSTAGSPGSLSGLPQTPLFNEVMNMVNPEKTIDYDELQVTIPNGEKENRDSNMSTMTVTPATIVRDAAVATRARANVIVSPVLEDGVPRPMYPISTLPAGGLESDDSDDSNELRSTSPSSSESHSSGTSMVASLTPSTSASASAERSRTCIPYVESSPLPSPLAGTFGQSALSSAAVRQYKNTANARPSIVIQGIDKVIEVEESRIPSPYSSPAAASPLSPTPQYSGWVSEVVGPIREFIIERVDPHTLLADLQEIAEGESGSVYSARVLKASADDNVVAIKKVTLLPSPSEMPKLSDLKRELTTLKDVRHSHVLCLDAIYIDQEEDALWIRMELMDRSLADIIALADEGLILQEKQMALVARDVLSGLDYLQQLGIAHRDLRSDNLLLSPEGLVKLADFSNSVKVPLLEPTRSDPAGVHFWQAPEMRSGPYNALKVDVWSLGATVWEMAQTEPPFSDATDLTQLGDRWPELSQPEIFSRSFHDFLHLCSEPSSSRPDPNDLLNTPFVRNAGERSILLQVLSQCKSVEMSPRRQSTSSHETIS